MPQAEYRHYTKEANLKRANWVFVAKVLALEKHKPEQEPGLSRLQVNYERLDTIKGTVPKKGRAWMPSTYCHPDLRVGINYVFFVIIQSDGRQEILEDLQGSKELEDGAAWSTKYVEDLKSIANQLNTSKNYD